MTEQKKPLQVRFEPGCFDELDCTQEELDALAQEIETLFASMTPEELEARSVVLTDEDLKDLPPKNARH
jgi:hypothetical protein